MKRRRVGRATTVCLIIRLGCVGLIGIGTALGAAALPPDAALTIPKEDGFEELKIEGINDVALYNRYPASWAVTDLSSAWQTNALSESCG